MIFLVPPLGYKFSVEDENVEGVEEDNVVFDGHTVEKYGHTRRSIKSVRHKRRPNHNKRVVNVLFIQGITKIIISLKLLY